jgi:hypothetical protein
MGCSERVSSGFSGNELILDCNFVVDSFSLTPYFISSLRSLINKRSLLVVWEALAIEIFIPSLPNLRFNDASSIFLLIRGACFLSKIWVWMRRFFSYSYIYLRGSALKIVPSSRPSLTSEFLCFGLHLLVMTLSYSSSSP